jgi:hypothetical protein
MNVAIVVRNGQRGFAFVVSVDPKYVMTAMDLSFLRTLASSNLPRLVPPGPAFHLVLAYQAAGLIEVSIPPVVRTRSGSSIQHDAVVTAITDEGRAALRSDGRPSQDSNELLGQ